MDAWPGPRGRRRSGCAPLALLSNFAPADASILRERLRAIGADRDSFSAGAEIPPGVPEALRIPIVWRELRRRGDHASVAALLFSFGGVAGAAEAGEALGRDVVAALLRAGVLGADGTDVWARFRLTPFFEHWIVADDPSSGPDAVMPPGPTTAQLARLLPEVSGAVALDLGCGPGSLGILMAARGGRVVATDINPRACALAAFNAMLNDVALDVREGDLYAPVGEQRFDLIASQPPYVLRPADLEEVTYLHGGAYGDELALEVLAGAADHLNAGGLALALFDSPVRKDSSLEARVRAAVDEHAVDVLAIAVRGLPPDWQAISYAELAEPDLGPAYEVIAQRYRAHLEHLGIDAVTHSVVILRKPTDRSRPRWSLEVASVAVPGAWDEIATFIRGMELAALPVAELLRSSLRPRPGAAIETRQDLADPAADPSYTLSFPVGSIATEREITEAASVLFQLLARDPSVPAAVAAFAEANGSTDVEAQEIVSGFVREGLVRGLLVPAN